MSGFSGNPVVDLSQLIAGQSNIAQLLAAIQQVLKGGVAIQPQPPVYLVANLPTSATNGQFAFASNGRKGGEGSGAGTGVPVYYNAATSQWFCYYNNLAVTS